MPDDRIFEGDESLLHRVGCVGIWLPIAGALTIAPVALALWLMLAVFGVVKWSLQPFLTIWCAMAAVMTAWIMLNLLWHGIRPKKSDA